MKDFLGKVYEPLADTQVGAHFWSVGGDVANWNSKVVGVKGLEELK